jgi:hypothetical protein
VQKILHWHHTGFNVHSKVRAQTKSEAESVVKYNAHRGKIHHYLIAIGVISLSQCVRGGKWGKAKFLFFK